MNEGSPLYRRYAAAAALLAGAKYPRLVGPPCTAHLTLPQEASFKEFLARPENAALVEAQQRKEVKQAVQLQEKMRALQFRDKARTRQLLLCCGIHTAHGWGRMLKQVVDVLCSTDHHLWVHCITALHTVASHGALPSTARHRCWRLSMMRSGTLRRSWRTACCAASYRSACGSSAIGVVLCGGALSWSVLRGSKCFGASRTSAAQPSPAHPLARLLPSPCRP